MDRAKERTVVVAVPVDNPVDIHSRFTLKVPTIPCHLQQNQTLTNDVSSPTSKTPPDQSTNQSLLRRAICASNGTTLSEDTDGDRTPPHAPSSDSSPSSNFCPECGKNLRYRSSFRRHMRLHQGVFYSHVCAVCRRKFTRKEHLLRHKCNRRSYLPSRSADNFRVPESETSLPSLVEKVIMQYVLNIRHRTWLLPITILSQSACRTHRWKGRVWKNKTWLRISVRYPLYK